MNLAGGTVTNSQALYNLNIDPSSAGTVSSAISHSVYGTRLQPWRFHSINASRTTTLQAAAPNLPVPEP